MSIEKLSVPRKIRALLLLLTTGLIPGAFAQEASSQDFSIRLGLQQAVDMAMAVDGNARVQLAGELIRQAQSRSAQARAPLLPNLDAYFSQQSRTLNLAAAGLKVQLPIPGFSFPRFVGPFSSFDARATGTQSIFDLSSIRRFQAARLSVGVAELERESLRDQVASQVAKSYLAALRAEATVDAVKANLTLAEALLQLALNQRTAGTGTGIEVTRARVQLSNERQRLLVAENERKRAGLELRRAIGIGLGGELELLDKLAHLSFETISLERALAVAQESRPDFRVQVQREESVRLTYDATKLERLPSLMGFADYGSIGSSLDTMLPTRTFGLSVRLPVFDGGRRDARRAESLSQVHQEQIKTKDLQQQIELEVRLALDSLSSAEEQLKVASEGLELSDNELAQARRRYEAGLASNIEITDAQTRLARARDNRVAALFNFNLARINLGQATGTIRRVTK